MNISFYLKPKSEVAYVHEEDTVAKALKKIHERGYQAVPIIDKAGNYRGTVTEGDFLWCLTNDYHSDLSVMKNSTVHSLPKKWDYKAVNIDAKFEELSEYIVNQNFVPVVDGRGIFIGIVTRKEIITQLLKETQQ